MTHSKFRSWACLLATVACVVLGLYLLNRAARAAMSGGPDLYMSADPVTDSETPGCD